MWRGGSLFADAASGRIFRQELSGGTARPITPAFGHAAAPALSPDGRWLLYIHSDGSNDVIALVDAHGKQWPQRLIGGHDFYMQPTWHPNGQQIAFVAWNHPQMPWDGSTLYLADLDLSGSAPQVREQRVIAGAADVAVFQPTFSPDGRYLAFVSDTSGWGQLYVWEHSGFKTQDSASAGQDSDLVEATTRDHTTMRQLSDVAAEHGEPAWAQGMRTLAWSHDSRAVYVLRNERGSAGLYRHPLDGAAPTCVSINGDYSWFEQPTISPQDSTIAVIAAGGTQPLRLLLVRGETTQIIRRTNAESVAPSTLGQMQAISWEAPGGVVVHGILTLPPGHIPGNGGALPPAIVRVHGGPTGQSVVSYSAVTQFFVTRGYVVLDVNYRGSSGYGREYMLALRGNWGRFDVEDCVSAARFLGAQGLADAQRIAIMGGSAGGYTVLEALCRAPGVFRAGLCLYGVSNMFTLAADTHKFEAHYLDSLLGPLPEAAHIYRERSPDLSRRVVARSDRGVSRCRRPGGTTSAVRYDRRLAQNVRRATRVSHLCRGRSRLAQGRDDRSILYGGRCVFTAVPDFCVRHRSLMPQRHADVSVCLFGMRWRINGALLSLVSAQLIRQLSKVDSAKRCQDAVFDSAD
ncbi:S9 family peptidase [Candidatus Gracilibacteria bacterium]|nr:S9 family peptidase [Candidatus Gracilibacteria bacterium]